MKMKCLIIDDEPLAHRVIERYSENLPFLEVVRSCNSALEAIELIHQDQIDLIFLDINMPRLTGIAFLKTLKTPPLVIITTAYAEFAIQGYELDVVDYLMKPFSFERFLRAVQKAEEISSGKRRQPIVSTETEKKDDFIFIKSNKRTYKITLDEILYIEALGDYVKIFTHDRMIISYQSLKNLVAMLPSKQFPRVHKSYIISLGKIESIEGNQIKIKDKLIPLGTNYKQEFEKLVRSY